MNFKKILLALTLLSPISVFAQVNMELWPVNVSATATDNAPTLWLENMSNTATSLQIRVLNWKQENNNNIYSDQDNVYPEPSFIVIAAGHKIPVRFFGINKNGDKEESYKIVIDELPKPDNDNNSGIKMRMQYILPLFSYQSGINANYLPGADGLPKENHNIDWSINNNSLKITNNSVTHIKISDISVCTRKNECIKKHIPINYVLPGNTMTFNLGKGDYTKTKKLILTNGLAQESFELNK